MKSSYVISIGGMCNIAYTCRSMSKTQDAFPFDFIRTTFEGICHYIKTDFSEFCNFSIQQMPFEDNNIYYDERHAFVHHDITKPEQMNAFKRRCNRFMNVCKSEDFITFVRIITAESIWSELGYIEVFNKIMAIKYPNLHYELIMLIDSNVDKIDRLYNVYPKTKLYRCNVTEEIGNGKNISTHLSEILLKRSSKLEENNVLRYKHWNTVCGI